MTNKPWEGRSVWADGVGNGARKGWVETQQADGGVTFSVGGLSVTMTPEAALVLAKQISALARDMIKRREVQ